MPYKSRGAAPAPRGRPYRGVRAVADAAPPGTARAAQERVAWLLRTNRIYARDERWSRISGFATAFRGGCYPAPASQSKISRWETGAVRAPYQALRRYEELLEMPEGLLVAAADTIYRYAAPAASGPPTLDRGELLRPGPAAYHRLEELAERAQSGALVSGPQWDELTGIISALPDLYFVPRTIWARLAERLLSEMIIADGVPWLQRFEALNRLLGHPVGQEAAVAALAAAAADRTNEGFVEIVGAFDASRHPDASRHVLAQLTQPTNERARYGALLACVRKVKYGHFTDDQLRGLLPTVGAFLEDPASPGDVRALAVELLRRLPAMPAAAQARLRQALQGDRILGQVLSAGRLADAQTAAVVVERLVGPAMAGLARDVPSYQDDTIAVLVDEMLFDPILDIRLYASMLIYATPYRFPTATALTAELHRTLAARDLPLAGSILGALRFLGGADQRPVVERLILDGAAPAEIPATAAHHLGHLGGHSDDQFWRAALAHHGERWQRLRDPASAATLHGLVYGLGMARHETLLAQVRGDSAVPPPTRTAASWWANRATLISESARL